ncbi:MAG: ABC transporter permease [Candidatus Aminicenantes bacterium]
MFKNYFKILVRNWQRNKGYSMINISGLAIGMVCCILVLLWVRDELSFDRFNQNADDIYRVCIEDHFPDGRVNAYGVTPGPLGEALKSEYPEVIDYMRVRVIRSTMVKVGDTTFNEKQFAFADPSIFSIFTFPFLKGDAGNALSNLSSIVLTRSASKKYFGDTDPLGKTLHVDNRFDFKVTGVIEDVPANAHFTFDFVVPYELRKQYGARIDDWGSVGTYTYILLQKDFPYLQLETKIRDYLKKKNPESITELSLQPLTRIHLYSKSILGMGGDGDVRYIYIFSLIAVFVLLIACINFMNLTTARSGKRAQEVGMRKVTGARRKDLILQFFSESVFFSLAALLMALVLVKLLLPAFNILAGKQLTLDFAKDTTMILWLAAIALFTGIISGIYPALVLSSHQPAVILKGAKTQGKSGAKLRKTLVVTQFTLSIILIISTLLVSHQVNYMRNQDLGFEKEHLVYVNLPGSLIRKYEAIKNEFLANPDIVEVTTASDLPTRVRISTHGANWEGKNPDEMVEIKILYTDHDYLKTLELKTVDGRFFSKDFSTDAKEAFILNESAIKAMGITSPVGKKFEFDRKGSIVGVVKDFHFTSLHHTIQPLMMMISPEKFTHFIIRIKSTHIPETIDFLKDKWANAAAGVPFEYGFVDESIDNLYRAEQRIGTILRYFTFLSIFISCLGLFGLASFMAEQRTREIAVRRVFGAQVQGIIYLLSKEFVKWVILANIIAWPIAYLIMNQWLQNFAYRINIGAGTFIIAGFMALIISLFTVSYQILRAATANPVEALKYE